MDNRCGDCKYLKVKRWKRENLQGEWSCGLRVPSVVVIADEAITVWPAVCEDDWCGEWEEGRWRE